MLQQHDSHRLTLAVCLRAVAHECWLRESAVARQMPAHVHAEPACLL